MEKLVKRFAKNEEGASLVEYGMLLALIAVVCIAVVTGLGETVSSVFSLINKDLVAIL